ncbi:hypothetical protein [Archangium gephyra]|nr:hypothetical protein [Archangium gephyra]AKJ02890.1 Hypothetical protein AA314_04516 [Archangium gephyra]
MDPTKRVNYVLGMVLGVDDFTQEFTYLSERDRWLTRELLGYGTVWGLAVTQEPGTRGPEVRVSPGVAVSPRGNLLRVTPAQCASLNDWLAARTPEVSARMAGASPGTRLKVYVVLGYDECLTDAVPIPGEPCRTEEDATKPSRIADDFTLELSFTPPAQHEEDALRDLVRWLRTHIQVSSTPGTSVPLDAFLGFLRGAVLVPPGSPPSPPWSPSDFLLDTSPASPLVVATEDLCRYLRAALRVWVTELRHLWRTNWLGEAQGCMEPLTPVSAGGEDRVLLAELSLPVTRELEGGAWKVASAPAKVDILEDGRPFVAHLRLLQEWMLCGTRPDTPAPAPAANTVTRPAGMPAYSIVAAGILPPVPPEQSFNALKIIGTADGSATLTFTGYQNPTGKPFQYIVKALLVSAPAVKGFVVTLGGFQANGFVLNVSDAQGAPVPVALMNNLRLVVEVSQYQAG